MKGVKEDIKTLATKDDLQAIKEDMKGINQGLLQMQVRPEWDREGRAARRGMSCLALLGARNHHVCLGGLLACLHRTFYEFRWMCMIGDDCMIVANMIS
jgi:hypothetical protein